jgi:uncharacterized protein YndB with AHSA1/START domain
MKRRRMGIVALVCACAPGWLAAEVADSSAGGFTLKQTYTIKATPQEVYRRIFKVGDWWSSQHTFSGDAHNLSIEEKAGGCFCEKMPNGGGVKHLEVVFLAPGKSIVMHGGLGPMQTLAATGSMQFQLTAADGGTKLEVTYAVTGYLPAGMNTWAAPVDGVLNEQFTRLKSLIENGDPAK